MAVQKFKYPKRQDCSKLYTEQEKAKYEYNTNPLFKLFVDGWNNGYKEVLGVSLTDFYKAYNRGGAVQLKLGF